MFGCATSRCSIDGVSYILEKKEWYSLFNNCIRISAFLALFFCVIELYMGFEVTWISLPISMLIIGILLFFICAVIKLIHFFIKHS